MNIDTAKTEEYNSVRDFYYEVIDGLKDKEYAPGWERDIYPSQEQLKDLIGKKELFIGTENGRVIAAMAVNHESNESYEGMKWQIEASRDEAYVIHMLATLPECARKGLAKEMVRYAIDKAKREGGKAVRLDVLKGNYPANRLYEGFGFKKLDTIQMFYPDTGWTDFELYELVL